MRQIYINGKVYTGELPLQEAFVVDNGKFGYVGSTEELMMQKEYGDEVHDLEGRFVCAGFNDSHMHLVNLGYTLGMADLSKHTKSLADVKNAMKDFIRENHLKPGTWVRGRGWNQDYFEDEKRFPNRWDLDEVSTEYPICITRACGHTCVANSLAIRLAGVTKDTPAAEGGIFETDENGEPNGVFRENAMNLIYSSLPVFTVEDIKEIILRSSRALNSYGITSSQTDDLPVFSNVSYDKILEAYEELRAEGKMTVRVNQQSQLMSLEELKDFMSRGYHTGSGDEWFRIGPFKIVADGSLGSRTAYMSVPYADAAETRGMPIYTGKQLEDMIGYAHEQNMQIAVHAIGDGILDDILAAYEKALKEHPRKDHRHGIVHCQIMRPDQLKKIEELELHAYFQSIFLDYDIHIVEDRVGKERAASSYNYKTLYDTVHASNGSDAPVEFPDVMAGIQCAVTRTTLKDHVGPYLPEQCLTVKEALDSFTKEGAHASFEEDIKGQISRGMLADFVILEKNPFETDPYALKDIRICDTYVGGEMRYHNPEF